MSNPKIITTTSAPKELEQLREIIKKIEEMDDVPDPDGTQKHIVEAYNEELQSLTGNNLSTRIWEYDGRLHCTVIYPNSIIRDMINADIYEENVE